MARTHFARAGHAYCVHDSFQMIDAFREAISQSGLPAPSEVIADGKIHRFSTNGRKSDQAGWYVLYPDGAGAFGCWRAGVSYTWCAHARKYHELDDWERHDLKRRFEDIRLQREIEEARQYAEAARKAQWIWQRALPAPEHFPYLASKQVRPHQARIYRGSLTLPIVTLDGELVSIQFIGKDGMKRLLNGGRKKGCVIPVDGALTSSTGRIMVCEGWATGATLAEEVPDALVLAAIDAGNLLPVALGIHQRWPRAELIIAGDDDRKTPGNPGRTKALEAARASGALVAFPQWPPGTPQKLSDFNDLRCWLAAGHREAKP